MRWSLIRTRAQAMATLATLQSGIEPVTLAILAANQAVDPKDFGWIVAAGQVGMACGALLGWLGGTALRRPIRMGPAIGIGASLAMSIAHGLATVLILRLILGIAMGTLLTRATALAARERPHHAIGMIFLAQQLVSTIVLAGLPIIAAGWGAPVALCVLALAPAAIALLQRDGDEASRPMAAEPGVPAGATVAIVPDLAPMAMILAVTMMLWSYVATIGETHGLNDIDIGFAIALGSFASVPAAALAAFSGPRFHPWLTALLCGVGMLMPLAVPIDAGFPGYLTGLILFNAGSTFGIIRFTGWAMERRAQGRQRRFVTLIQCAAMAGGPILGAIAMRAGGLTALGVLAAAGLAAAMLMPAIRRSDRSGLPAIGDALPVAHRHAPPQ